MFFFSWWYRTVQFDFRIATPYDDLHIAEQINLYENATGKFSSKQMFFSSNSYYISFITTINKIIHARHGKNKNTYSDKISVIKMVIHVLWVIFKCVKIQTFNNDINSSDLKAKGIFSFQPFFCLRTIGKASVKLDTKYPSE